VERTFIAQHGLAHVCGSVEDAGSARELADRIVPSGVPVYLHVDLDLLDPGAFDGLCCPEPGGWSPEALTAFCARVHQRCHVVGLGLMEHLPRPGADLAPLAGFLELARTLFPG
jgi:arginase